jgi:hypothetical protein
VNHPRRDGWLFVFLSGASLPDEIKFYSVDPIGFSLSWEENLRALINMRAMKLCLVKDQFNLTPEGENFVAMKRKIKKHASSLKQVGASIGSAMGRVDRRAHQFARSADRKAHQLAKAAAVRSRKISKAGTLAKAELQNIGKQIDALKAQLLKTTRRLKHALS